jgi:hypothetical protein
MDDFPDLVEFIETTVNDYFEKCCEDFAKNKIFLQNHAVYWPFEKAMLVDLLHYLKVFPFQAELLLFSTTVNEGSADSYLYLEAKKIILEIHSFILNKASETQTAFAKLQFGFDYLKDINISL